MHEVMINASFKALWGWTELRNNFLTSVVECTEYMSFLVLILNYMLKDIIFFGLAVNGVFIKWILGTDWVTAIATATFHKFPYALWLNVID